MEKITKIVYDEIEPSVLSASRVSEFHLYQNTMWLSDEMMKSYESYQMEESRIMNTLLAKSIVKNNLRVPPKVSTALIGVSNPKRKIVLIAEVRD